MQRNHLPALQAHSSCSPACCRRQHHELLDLLLRQLQLGGGGCSLLSALGSRCGSGSRSSRSSSSSCSSQLALQLGHLLSQTCVLVLQLLYLHAVIGGCSHRYWHWFRSCGGLGAISGIQVSGCQLLLRHCQLGMQLRQLGIPASLALQRTPAHSVSVESLRQANMHTAVAQHSTAQSPTCATSASAPTAASTSLLASCTRSLALASTARAALAWSALLLLLGGTAAAASGWVWVWLLPPLGSDTTSPPSVAAALLMLTGISRGALLLPSSRKPLRSCSTAPVGAGVGVKGGSTSDLRHAACLLHCNQFPHYIAAEVAARAAAAACSGGERSLGPEEVSPEAPVITLIASSSAAPPPRARWPCTSVARTARCSVQRPPPGSPTGSSRKGRP